MRDVGRFHKLPWGGGTDHNIKGLGKKNRVEEQDKLLTEIEANGRKDKRELGDVKKKKELKPISPENPLDEELVVELHFYRDNLPQTKLIDGKTFWGSGTIELGKRRYPFAETDDIYFILKRLFKNCGIKLIRDGRVKYEFHEGESLEYGGAFDIDNDDFDY